MVQDLRADGVIIHKISPGFLAANLGDIAVELKSMGTRDPLKGGRLVRRVVEDGMDTFEGER